MLGKDKKHLARIPDHMQRKVFEKKDGRLESQDDRLESRVDRCENEDGRLEIFTSKQTGKKRLMGHR